MPTITPTLTPVALAAATSPDPLMLVLLTAALSLVTLIVGNWVWGLIQRNWQHGDRHIELVREAADDNYQHLWDIIKRTEDKIESARGEIAHAHETIVECQRGLLKVELGLERLDGAVQMQLEIARLKGLVSPVPGRGNVA